MEEHNNITPMHTGWRQHPSICMHMLRAHTQPPPGAGMMLFYDGTHSRQLHKKGVNHNPFPLCTSCHKHNTPPSLQVLGGFPVQTDRSLPASSLCSCHPNPRACMCPTTVQTHTRTHRQPYAGCTCRVQGMPLKTCSRSLHFLRTVYFLNTKVYCPVGLVLPLP
jgi:hypothetical protein